MSALNAMLVRLSISQFGNTRQDPSITSEVKALHKLTGKAGRWVKIKLPEEAMAEIGTHASRCRQAHYELTLPWIEGFRLLTSAGRSRYEETHAKLQTEFNTRVEAFIAKYPEWIEEAKKMHNGTFNPNDYPDAERLRLHFQYLVEYSPVPQGDHFTNVVAGPQLQRLREQLEEANRKRVDDAVRETWDRLLIPVRAMADRLSDRDAVFRESLVGNIREIVDLIPALNLVNDPQLKAAASQIESQLASLDPNILRLNTVVRRAAAATADAIVKRFGSLGSRKLA